MPRVKKQKRTRRYRGGAVPTFHVLIVSGGRATLRNMLDSLKPQLREGDGLTVVFDGKNAKGLSQYNDSWKEGFACPFTLIEEEIPMGKFGQPLHNKYQSLLHPRTTYIMHADDDDEYVPGAFDALRVKCTNPTRLYIARMTIIKGGVGDQPLTNDITLGLVGLPSGITPFDDAPKSRWGENPQGDFDYYNDLKTKVASIEFLPDIIYQVGQDQGDVNVTKLGNVTITKFAGGRKYRRRNTKRKRRQRGGDSLPRKIWCMWLGGTPLSEKRQESYDTVVKNAGVPVVLITDDTLSQYILPEYPLHEGYQYLSGTHKCDYMRTYLMHHHGGGYTDIKKTTESWAKAFDEIAAKPDIWVNGYKEVGPNGLGLPEDRPDRWDFMKANWERLVGNGAYICRSNTPLTTEWMRRLNAKMDGYLAELKQHPAADPRDVPGMMINGVPSKYPVPWTAILGNIFHDVCLDNMDHIMQTVPAPAFTDYM